MKRAQLTYCADIDATRFNLLRQRDQLPFYVAENPTVAKWSDYTIEDAFQLRLMLDLLGGDEKDAGGRSHSVGLSPSYAANVAGNAACITCKDAFISRPSIWIGVVAFEGMTRGDERTFSRAHYWGGLAGLSDWIDQTVSPWTSAYKSYAPTRTFLANATRAAEFVMSRAVEIGVPEATA